MSTSRSRLRVAVSHLAYDALIALTCLVALPAWLVRATRDPNPRRWIRQRIFGRLPPGLPTDRPVWIHAVSVGEVKAVRPLVAELRARHPTLPLVITTGTSTGYETALEEFPGTYVCHAPLDIAWVVRRVVRRIAPRLIVLVELEVWPAFLRVADEEGVPLTVVNGRITAASWTSYRRFSWWLPEYDRLGLVTAQDETQAGRFASLGVPAERIVVAGNLKHDMVGGAEATADAGARRDLRAEWRLDDGRLLFVAGSTHDGEDQAAVLAWRAAGGAQASRLALVPRHLTRVRDIQRQLRKLGVRATLRSEMSPGQAPGDIILVDSMGELEDLFGVADVVFLGGSLAPIGGHNVLEPAAAGVPVLVGPHLESCAFEAERLSQAGGLQVVADAAELGRRLATLLSDPEERRRRGAAAAHAVQGLRGASRICVDLLEQKGLLFPRHATD